MDLSFFLIGISWILLSQIVESSLLRDKLCSNDVLHLVKSDDLIASEYKRKLFWEKVVLQKSERSTFIEHLGNEKQKLAGLDGYHPLRTQQEGEARFY